MNRLLRRVFYSKPVNGLVRSALWPAKSLLPESALISVNGIVKVDLKPHGTIRIAANPTSNVARKLYWKGAEGFEYGVVRVFIGLVSEARIFLDVGANIGYYSLVGSQVNPELLSFAFEPEPGIARYLNKNISLNDFEKRIRSVQVALGQQPGREVFVPSRNPKFPFIKHHLSGTGKLETDQKGSVESAEPFEVDVTTLDDFVRSSGIDRVDLVKLDTEGTEDKVLLGATEILTRDRPVIFCEILPSSAEPRVGEILRSFGYTFLRGEEHGLVRTTSLTHGAGSPKDYMMIQADHIGLVSEFLAPKE